MALRYRNNKHQRMDTYILIGDGFDELEVIYFLHKFRRAGLPIKSVSLYGPLVFSRQGVGLKADYELADKPFDQITDFLLILPTGGRNGDMLRHDARIRALLQTVDNGNGRIAITEPQSALASDLDKIMGHRPPYQPQGNEDLNDFIESLTSRLGLMA
ncbi:MAG: DJ-1/PfpI family protein [Anaerolineales bacterium]|nr:DJ-1/PfpI family protein [Anaerolineales bacterium]MCB8990478.1 DJ-1/PfpI family protein [Ardenticatenaceae bacterium]MCB9003492.1 DJ-1/PfpI family protein [Ardenticatenaceae bacterium]